MLNPAPLPPYIELANQTERVYIIYMKTIIKKAFSDSLPVLMGYVSMGMAFGILLVAQVKEAHAGSAALMSFSTISGSMQFAAVEMLKNSAAYTLLLTAVMALLINIRYSMYGISLVRYFRNYPWYIRCYLIWSLTDETYALESSTSFRGKKRMYYSLFVAMFDHCYWLTGSVLGAMAGEWIPFDTTGIDFAMTALFLVILVDLVRKRSNRIPAVVGGGSTLLALIFFVAFFPAQVNRMLLAAMTLMIIILMMMYKKTEAAAGRVER